MANLLLSILGLQDWDELLLLLDSILLLIYKHGILFFRLVQLELQVQDESGGLISFLVAGFLWWHTPVEPLPLQEVCSLALLVSYDIERN